MKTITPKRKRLLSLVLTLVMVLGLLPTDLFTVEAKAVSYTSSSASDYVFYLVSAESKTAYVNQYKSTSAADSADEITLKVPDTIRASDLSGSAEGGALKEYLDADPSHTVNDTLTVVRTATSMIPAKYRDKVVSVQLGANIQSISSYVFANAANLREVTLAAGSQLKTIGDHAFSDSAKLARVGINGTGEMPASLTMVEQGAFSGTKQLQSLDFSDCTGLYRFFTAAFSGSGISSIQLPPNLKYIDDLAFQNCANLSGTLEIPASCGTEATQLPGEDEASAGWLGSRVFENCVSLNGITFRGGLAIQANGTAGYAAFKGLKAGCVIRIPQPSASAYSSTVSRVYNHMGANADVQLRWIGGSSGQAAPVSSGVTVTLSGADATATPAEEDGGEGIDALYTLNYDVNDTDRDGLGGYLIVKGRQNVNDPLTLTLSGASDADYVVWGRQQAFGSQREGTIDGEPCFGSALAQRMRETQPLGSAPSNTTTSGVQSLTLSNSNELGAWYYIPMLVKQGMASAPQTSVSLPPVLVIYQPDEGAHVTAAVSSHSTTLSVRLTGSTAAASDFEAFDGHGLFSGINVYSTGYLGLLPDVFTNVMTPTVGETSSYRYDDENKKTYGIFYQWQVQDKNGYWSGLTDYQGYATYNGYESIGPSGIQWKTGGIAPSYFVGKALGSYTFRLWMQVRMGESIPALTENFYSSNITLNLYQNLTEATTSSGWDVTSEAGTGNWTYNAEGATNNGTQTAPAEMKIGAKNITLTPTVSGLENLTGCTVKYDYSIYKSAGNNTWNSVTSISKTTGGFDPGANLTEEGLYRITPTVFLYDGSGPQLTDCQFNNNAFYIQVTGTADYTGLPTFDADAMQVVYFDYTGVKNYKNFYLPGTNMNNIKTVELYQATDRNSNTGGTCLSESSNFTIDTADENGVTVSYAASFFKDYTPRWCYFKVTTGDGAVVYSPVFATLPNNACTVDRATNTRTVSAQITSTPGDEVWMESNKEVFLTYGVRLTNVPMRLMRYYGLKAYNPVISWQHLNAAGEWTDTNTVEGKIEASNAGTAFDLTSVNIVNGNLVLEGTITFTTKYRPGESGGCFTGDSYPNTSQITQETTRLVITNAWECSSTSDTNVPLTSLTPTDASAKTTVLTKADAVPGLSSILTQGGKALWNSTTKEYEISDQLDTNTVVLFSEDYDGKKAGDTNNQPASEVPVQFALAGLNSIPERLTREVRMLVYRNGTKVATLDKNNSSYTYGSDDTISVEYVNGYDSSATVTVAVPTTAAIWKFELVPQAVFLDSNRNVVSATSGATWTMVINPDTYCATPVASKSDLPYYFDSAQVADAKNDAVVTTLDTVAYTTRGYHGTLTAQWYFSRTAKSTLDSTMEPLGTTFYVGPGSGNLRCDLPLTGELLRKVSNYTSSGVGYFYLYMTHTDETAIRSQTATRLQLALTVRVGSYYTVAKPQITGSTTTSATIAWGQDAPADMLSLTTNFRPSDVNRTVSIRRKVVDRNTDEEYICTNFTVGTWNKPATGEQDYPQAINGTVALNGDGTVTWTADPKALNLGISRDATTSDGVTYSSGDFDITYFWTVTDTYKGSLETATAGKTSSDSTGEYTIHQVCPEVPKLTNLTLDSTASDNNAYTVTVPDTIAAGFGLPAGTEIPAFRQQAANLRPFSATLKLETWQGGAYGANVSVEKWDNESKSWGASGETITADQDTLQPGQKIWPDGTTFTCAGINDAWNGKDYYYNNDAVMTVKDSNGNDVQAILLRLAAQPRVPDGSTYQNLPTRPGSQVFALVRTDPTAETTDAEWAKQERAPKTQYQVEANGTIEDIELDLGKYTGTNVSWKLLTGERSVVLSGESFDVTPTLDPSRPELVAARESAKSGESTYVQYSLEITNYDSGATGIQYRTTTVQICVYFGTLSPKPVVELRDADGKALGKTLTLWYNAEQPTITAAVTNDEALGTGHTLTYTWYISRTGGDTWTPSATGQSLAVPTTNKDITHIKCVVLNKDPNATVNLGTAGEAVVELAVAMPPKPTSVKIYAHTKDGAYVNSFHKGGSLTFGNEVEQPPEPSAPDAVLQYQWYICPTATFDDEAPRTSGSSFSLNANNFTGESTTCYVFLEVFTTQYGYESERIRSAGYRVNLLENYAPSLSAAQTSFTVDAGQTQTLTVTAASGNTSGDQPYGTMEYTWFVSSTPSFSAAYRLSTGTSNTYTPETMADGGVWYYWARAQERSASGTVTENSEPLMFTVFYQKDGAAAPPQVVRKTDTVTRFTADGSVKLEAEVTSLDGGNLTMQWYKVTESGAETALTGQTGTSYTAASPATPGMDRYILRATNTKNGQTAQSEVDFYVVRQGFAFQLPELPGSLLTGETLSTGYGTITWYGDTDYTSFTITPPSWMVAKNISEDGVTHGVMIRWRFTLSGTATATIPADSTLKADIELADKTTITDTCTLGPITVADCKVDQSKVYLGVMDSTTLYGGVQLTASQMKGGNKETVSGTWTRTSGTLPEGVTLNSDGTFSLAEGKALGDPRSYPVSVTFTGTDGVTTASADVTLYVQSGENVHTSAYPGYVYLTDGTEVNLKTHPGTIVADGYQYDPDTGVLTLRAFRGQSITCNDFHCLYLLDAGEDKFSFLDAKDQRAAIRGSFHLLGSGTLQANLTLTDSNTFSPVSGVSGDVTLRKGFTGGLYVNVENGSTNVTPSVYGVDSLTQNSTGTVSVKVRNNGGASDVMYGVYHNMSVSGSGKVTVTADGGGSSGIVRGVSQNTTTAGTVDVTVSGVSRTGKGNGSRDATLGHTGGSAAFTGDSQALLWEPTNAANYQRTGNWSETSVTYYVDGTATPAFRLDGSAVSGSLALAFLPDESVSRTLRVACTGPVNITETGRPAWLTWNTETGALTGTAPATGSGTWTITAKNTDTSDETTLTIQWSVTAARFACGSSTDSYNPGATQMIAGRDNTLWFFVTSDTIPTSLTVQIGSGEAQTLTNYYSSATKTISSSTGTGAKLRINSTWSLNVDGSTLTEGTELEVTVTAYDEAENSMGSETFTLKVVPSTTPITLTVGSTSCVNLGVNDYAGTGWQWKAADLTLYLTDYNGGAIRAANGPLQVVYSGTNTVTGQSSTNGLEGSSLTLTAKEDGASLTVNTSFGRGIYLTGSTAQLILNGPGTVNVTSTNAGPLESTNNKAVDIRIDDAMKEVHLNGIMSKHDVTVEPGAVHYLYSSTAEGLNYGTTAPKPVVTVEGPDTVTIGTSVDLTASVQPWLTKITVYDAKGNKIEDTGTLSYQWADTKDAGFNSTDNPLTRASDQPGVYTCTVTYTSTYLGSASGTSDAHTLAVADPIAISGSRDGGSVTVNVKGLAIGTEATLIVAQYSGGKLVDVWMDSFTSNGSTYDTTVDFTASKGETYKIFLLNSDSKPLCKAKSPIVE